MQTAGCGCVLSTVAGSMREVRTLKAILIFLLVLLLAALLLRILLFKLVLAASRYCGGTLLPTCSKNGDVAGG